MSGKFCPMPFGSMHIDPNGDILVCCSDSGKMLDAQGKKYNVQTHTLEEAWNSEYYKDLRRKFLRGEQPDTCNFCWSSELNGKSVSTRISSLARYESFKKIDFDVETSVEQARQNDGVVTNLPVDYQVMSGNLCNLACKMCFPKYSNTWTKFYKNKDMSVNDLKFHRLMSEPQSVFTNFGETYDWPKTKTLDNIFGEFKDKVYHINITGGEPTLLEENIIFLEKLKQSKNAKNIEVQLISNGTNINSRLLDSLNGFRRVILTSSIDGMEEIAYIQRTPSNWDQIYKNYTRIRRFSEQNDNVLHTVTTTVTALNLHHLNKLWNFLVFAAECKIKPELITINIVINKSQSTGLEVVPRRIAEKIREEFLSNSRIKDSNCFTTMMSYFDSISWADNDDAIKDLLDTIQKLHPDLDIKKIYNIYYQ